MALGFYNSDEINDLKNKISNLEQQLNLINTDYFEISKNKSEEIINLHQKSNTD